MAYAPLGSSVMPKIFQLFSATLLLAFVPVVVQGIGGQSNGGQVAMSAAGDVARGKALVDSSGCFDCHRIGDRGSRLGPDLSDIGGRRTPERLQRALVAPDEEVIPENRFVRFVTTEGATVTGRLLNQDAISVQLINPKEELKSYLRATLREYVIVDKGLMPSDPYRR